MTLFLVLAGDGWGGGPQATWQQVKVMLPQRGRWESWAGQRVPLSLVECIVTPRLFLLCGVSDFGLVHSRTPGAVLVQSTFSMVSILGFWL